jgi:O-antigen/teichoic acid export membrane protein
MLILRIILSIVLFFAMVLAINLMGSPDETIQVVYVIAASTLLFVLNGAINCFFQAFEKMEYQSLGTGLFSVVMLVGTFYAIWNDLGIMGFAFVNLAANLVVICYSTIVCLALVVRPKLEADPEFLRSNVMESLPFGLAGFLQTIFYSFDAVLLFNMQGQEVVGWYSASARLVHYLHSYR